MKAYLFKASERKLSFVFLVDSGGALVATDRPNGGHPYFYVAGVFSFGRSSYGTNWPRVYTRVDSYINWILSHMRP